MIHFEKFISFNSWNDCIQLFNSSSLHESFNFSHSEWLVFFDVKFQTRSSDVDVERIDYNLWEGIHRPLLSLKNDVKGIWIRLYRSDHPCLQLNFSSHDETIQIDQLIVFLVPLKRNHISMLTIPNYRDFNTDTARRERLCAMYACK